MPLGHIAGVPLEETLAYVAPVIGTFAVAVAAYARQLRSRLTARRRGHAAGLRCGDA